MTPTTKQADELLSCPFCGDEAQVTESGAFVECRKHTRALRPNNWNQRASLSSPSVPEDYVPVPKEQLERWRKIAIDEGNVMLDGLGCPLSNEERQTCARKLFTVYQDIDALAAAQPPSAPPEAGKVQDRITVPFGFWSLEDGSWHHNKLLLTPKEEQRRINEANGYKCPEPPSAPPEAGKVITLDEHTKHVAEFICELYMTMVDPCADGKMTVKGMCDALLKAAVEQREQLHKLRHPSHPTGSEVAECPATQGWHYPRITLSGGLVCRNCDMPLPAPPKPTAPDGGGL